jgi:hypothetical protein
VRLHGSGDFQADVLFPRPRGGRRRRR